MVPFCEDCFVWLVVDHGCVQVKLCINSEEIENMLSCSILVCHFVTYLSVNLFHITSTPHHTNTITEHTL